MTVPTDAMVMTVHYRDRRRGYPCHLLDHHPTVIATDGCLAPQLGEQPICRI